MEVRDANGSTAEGDFLKLISETRQRLKSMITKWRYVRDKSINAASAKSPKAVSRKADLDVYKHRLEQHSSFR
jgi:hypothetical protein